MSNIGGGGGKGNVDVELNIVPFIDLMSVLASFLLVTAVIDQSHQLDIKPRGKSREQQVDSIEQQDKRFISCLVQEKTLWIAVKDGDVKPFERDSVNGQFPWEAIQAELVSLKGTADFSDRTDIEVAAESTASSPVAYSDLIYLMDRAKIAGFTDPGITDSAGLTVPIQR